MVYYIDDRVKVQDGHILYWQRIEADYKVWSDLNDLGEV